MKLKHTKLKHTIAVTALLLLIITGLVLFSNDGRTGSISSLSDPFESLLTEHENLAGGKVNVERLIDDYREWAVYPPNSRPLLPEHIDVIDFRRVHVPPQRMPRREGDSFRDSGFACQLQPEHHSLTEGESMRLFLSCMRTGRQERENLKVLGARLEAAAGERKFQLPAGSFEDSGKNGDETAGDGVYTLRFTPRKSDWAEVYVTVNFHIEVDVSRFEHSLAAHFFSSPEAPARFTGAFRETLSEGSLVVQAEVDVSRPGNYTLEANLMKDDEPVGYARSDVRLSSGRSWVDFQYFGKVIRDRGEAGPYQVRGLRGFLSTDVIQPEILSRSPAEVEAFLKSVRSDRPAKMLLPYHEGSFQTRSYELAEFSDAQYDSPEKRQRLDDLMALR